ncbi:Flavonoid 3'-monooxygenase [Sesamum angolense]|uniref:Flavonoid 3'-monooxygenase n=1 Tax=Sesamum angolense TaxID=2727404 RepID=A0AAE1WW45_9LAMI|nr:Flavonoid 3'-monooxygenase [Sesamum angolense]
MSTSSDTNFAAHLLVPVHAVYQVRQQNSPMPPGPRGLPIVGFLPFLRPDMHIQFTELARQYGPIYRLWLGTKLCTVISSPSLIKEIVRDHDTIFANRDSTVATRIASYNGNDISFCPYDSSWRMRRKSLYTIC